MREIKFRAWNVLDKKMLNWGDIFHLPAWEIFPGTPEQRPFNIMQYTGMEDKNGREIYEGDIVRKSNGVVGVAVYFKAAAGYKLHNANYGQVFDIFETDAKYLEVIGNIYENPNLEIK